MERWNNLGECQTVGEVIDILKELPRDNMVTVLGMNCNIMYNGIEVVFEDEDRTEEWNAD